MNILALLLLFTLSAFGQVEEILLANKAPAAAPAGGISFVASYQALYDGLDPQTITGVTVPAGGIIVVFTTSAGGGEGITSVKFNATETFTSITNQNDKSGGVVADIAAYILHNPTATTANIVLDYASAPGGSRVAFALVYSGVKTDSGATGAYRALNCTGAGGGGVDVTVSASSGDWVVGCTSSYDTGATTLSASSHTGRRCETSLYSGNSYGLCSQDSNGAVSGSTTLTWANDDMCTSVGFALIPQ